MILAREASWSMVNNSARSGISSGGDARLDNRAGRLRNFSKLNQFPGAIFTAQKLCLLRSTLFRSHKLSCNQSELKK